jgi:hypothetical protein
LDTIVPADFKGTVQCDGYSAYPAFAKDRQGVKLFGCLARARRGFFEAKEQAPQVAGWILNQIGVLYRWEEQWRHTRAGPDGREVDARMVAASADPVTVPETGSQARTRVEEDERMAHATRIHGAKPESFRSSASAWTFLQTCGVRSIRRPVDSV